MAGEDCKFDLMRSQLSFEEVPARKLAKLMLIRGEPALAALLEATSKFSALAGVIWERECQL